MTFVTGQELDAGERYEVRACAGDYCRTARFRVPPDLEGVDAVGAEGLEVSPRDGGVALPLPDGDDGRERGVSVRIVDASGAVVADGSAQADFRSLQPNGPDCPPICWLAEVTI